MLSVKTVLQSLLFKLLNQKLISFVNFKSTIYLMLTKIYTWTLHYLMVKLQLTVNRRPDTILKIRSITRWKEQVMLRANSHYFACLLKIIYNGAKSQLKLIQSKKEQLPTVKLKKKKAKTQHAENIFFNYHYVQETSNLQKEN